MSANEIHVGDEGTRITVVFTDSGAAVDISGASTKQIWLRDPGGNCVKKDATFTTDGSDGSIYYDLATSDVDEAGDWEIQGYIVTASGKWHSDITTVGIFANADRA